jgi:hypothetical protein
MFAPLPEGPLADNLGERLDICYGGRIGCSDGNAGCQCMTTVSVLDVVGGGQCRC